MSILGMHSTFITVYYYYSIEFIMSNNLSSKTPILIFNFIILGCNHSNEFDYKMESSFSEGTKLTTGIQLIQTGSNLGGHTYKVPCFEEQNRNHYANRNDKISHLVMHYTVCNYPDTLNLFTKNKDNNRVSAQYVITEKEENNEWIEGGEIVEVVPNNMIAWHAGISKWQQSVGLNKSSIGIELVNKGYDCMEDSTLHKWYPFDQKQINSLGLLSQQIVEEHKINPTCVVGHADIAHNRKKNLNQFLKQDPGILFPWYELYSGYKIGAWLSEEEKDPNFIMKNFSPKEKFLNDPNVEYMSTLLSSYGYTELTPTSDPENETYKNALRAFQAHFSRNQKPKEYESPLNIVDQAWIYGLVGKYKNYIE